MYNRSPVKGTFITNQRMVLAILMIPVIGMIIAIPLIIMSESQNLELILGLIIFLISQYILLVIYISHKINKIEG